MMLNNFVNENLFCFICATKQICVIVIIFSFTSYIQYTIKENFTTTIDDFKSLI